MWKLLGFGGGGRSGFDLIHTYGSMKGGKKGGVDSNEAAFKITSSTKKGYVISGKSPDTPEPNGFFKQASELPGSTHTVNAIVQPS